MKQLGLIARVVAGAVLIIAGALKAAGAPEEFAIVIAFYNIIPPAMTMGVAAVLPWIELLIGFSLLFGYFSKPAAAGALALFSAFFLALLSTKIRGFDLPNCGCFGSGWNEPVWVTMIMDACLIGLSWLAFNHGGESAALDLWINPAKPAAKRHV